MWDAGLEPLLPDQSIWSEVGGKVATLAKYLFWGAASIFSMCCPAITENRIDNWLSLVGDEDADKVQRLHALSQGSREPITASLVPKLGSDVQSISFYTTSTDGPRIIPGFLTARGAELYIDDR